MWQDTPRKLKPVVVRGNPLRFWKRGGITWIILIVVLLAAGGLAVLVATLPRP